MRELSGAILLMLPLVVSGALHMLAVRRGWFSALRVPIHERYFGANKTWRGAALMPLFTVPGVWLAQVLEPLLRAEPAASLAGASAPALGIALGLAYVAAELPNSFVKRRLGVAPGGAPERARALFVFVDQADSAVGCVLVYALWGVATAPVLALCVLLGPLVHLAANAALYAAGLRKRPV